KPLTASAALPSETDLLCPRTGWLSGPVPRHPRGVSPLSRGGMSQPLSDPPPARPSFPPPPFPPPPPAPPTRRLPPRAGPRASPSAPLTVGLPSREDDGLTTLHRRNPRGLGPAYRITGSVSVTR